MIFCICSLLQEWLCKNEVGGLNMRFVKMHGLSNDYIFVETFTQSGPANVHDAAVELSKPHTGIGADGLILINPTDSADAAMQIFNADGSEAQICGNGLRCAARLLYESGLCQKQDMLIQTGAGCKNVSLHLTDGVIDSITADMGEPMDISQPVRLSAAGKTLTFLKVSIGNPHAVTFDDPAEGNEFYILGPAFERHREFPERANIEFCRILTRRSIHVRVWERGSGETMACGSGACAVLVAAVTMGLCDREASVTLPGGTLNIRWREEDGHLLMCGPAIKVFSGELE